MGDQPPGSLRKLARDLKVGAIVALIEFFQTGKSTVCDLAAQFFHEQELDFGYQAQCCADRSNHAEPAHTITKARCAGDQQAARFEKPVRLVQRSAGILQQMQQA